MPRPSRHHHRMIVGYLAAHRGRENPAHFALRPDGITSFGELRAGTDRKEPARPLSLPSIEYYL